MDEPRASRITIRKARLGSEDARLDREYWDLASPGIVYQIGVPPRRIDVLTSITAVAFDDAWPSRVTGSFGELECPFIGRAELARNKRALGRRQDLADLELLGEIG